MRPDFSTIEEFYKIIYILLHAEISIGINILKFKLKTGLLSSFPDEDRHKNGKFYSSDSLRLYISTGRANYISLIGKKN